MPPLALLSYLANHSDIRDWVAPGLPYVDVSHYEAPGVHIFGDERGVVLFAPLGPGATAYETHYLFTKAMRGKAALDHARSSFSAMFTEHHATVICGAVPREHRASRVMSRALGARPIGLHTDSFGRACILYAVERESWATLSAGSSAASVR